MTAFLLSSLIYSEVLNCFLFFYKVHSAQAVKSKTAGTSFTSPIKVCRLQIMRTSIAKYVFGFFFISVRAQPEGTIQTEAKSGREKEQPDA